MEVGNCLEYMPKWTGSLPVNKPARLGVHTARIQWGMNVKVSHIFTRINNCDALNKQFSIKLWCVYTKLTWGSCIKLPKVFALPNKSVNIGLHRGNHHYNFHCLYCHRTEKQACRFVCCMKGEKRQNYRAQKSDENIYMKKNIYAYVP